MTAWAGPTWAAISWRAPVTAWAVAALGALVVRGHGQPVISMFVAAVLASGSGLVGIVLDDDAHDMLAALPVGPRRRLVHRLAFVLPAVVGGSIAVVIVASGSITHEVVGALLALLLTGIAVFSVAVRISPPHAPAAAAAFAMLWSTCALVLGEHRWPAAFAGLWVDRPVMVAGVAVVTIAVALDV